MKKIYIPLLAVAVAVPSLTLTGCIEETLPTDRVTQDQLIESPYAVSSYAGAMPQFLNNYATIASNRHWDWGYGSMMHIRDVMTGDMAIKMSPSGYDWYDAWELNQNQDENKIYPQFIWNYYNQQVQTSNLTIGAVNPETANDDNLYLLGAAYAFRAMAYLDMARMYEYLPTDGTSAVNKFGNDVTGLTVPIVTEDMDESVATKNPRATHQEMLAFLLDDLQKAETYIVKGARPSKVMPSLACVYGLMARAYMWDEDYANARLYARKAIDTHGASTVTTKAQWLDKTTAFNTLDTPSWMWGFQTTSEDNVVKTGIINWTSWSSNEYKTGYSAAEPNIMIDARLYNSISDKDFRKLAFVAPEGSPLSGQENFINRAGLESVMVQGDYPVVLDPCASLKIKPGKGDMLSPDPACVVGIPLMRVEEMYFIEAEAAAHQSAGEGKSLIESFMRTYRYADYTCGGASVEAVVDEIFQQKRVEFFCEGIIFFDYKRLNKPVVRYYEGTNWREDVQFNTTTRPAWMNFVIVQTEGNQNSAVREFNNPDPSQCYTSLGVKEK